MEKKYPEFSESIQRGKAPADAKVAQALYKRAIGYSHDAVKIFSFEGATFEHKYIEHYPPDYNSMRLWLSNRQPTRWRDKLVLESEDSDATMREFGEAIKNSPTE